MDEAIGLKCLQCGTKSQPGQESCKQCCRPFYFKATIKPPRKRSLKRHNRNLGTVMTGTLVAAAIVMSLWWSPSLTAYSLGFACLAWVMWHFVSPSMASVMVHGFDKSRFHPDLGKYTLLGAFYSVLVRLFTAGGTFTSALIGLATLLLFLFPAALFLTVLYHKLSLSTNIRKVQDSFREKGAIPFTGVRLTVSGER